LREGERGKGRERKREGERGERGRGLTGKEGERDRWREGDL
jgi:hypothetical protein